MSCAALHYQAPNCSNSVLLFKGNRFGRLVFVQSSVNLSGALGNFVGGKWCVAAHAMGKVVLSHVEDAPSGSLSCSTPPAAPLPCLVCCAGPALPDRRHLIEEAVGLAGARPVTNKARLELLCMVTCACHASPRAHLQSCPVVCSLSCPPGFSRFPAGSFSTLPAPVLPTPSLSSLPFCWPLAAYFFHPPPLASPCKSTPTAPCSSQRWELRPVPKQKPVLAKNRVSFIPVASLIPPQMLRSLIKVSYGRDSVSLFSATPSSQKSKQSLVLSHEWKTGPQKQPAGCRLWLWGKDVCCLLGHPLGLSALFGFSSGSSLTYPMTRCWVVWVALWFLASRSSSVPGVIWYVCDFNFLFNFCWKEEKKLCEVEDLQRTYVVRPVGVLSG